MTENYRLNTIFKNNIFMLKLIAKYAPKLLIWSSFCAFIQSISWFVEHIVGIQFIMNTIQYGGNFIHIVYCVIIIWIFTLILHVSSGIYNENIRPKYETILSTKLKEDFYKKAKEIDLSCYDNPHFYNEFVWSIEEAPQRAMATISIFENLIKALVSVITAIGFFVLFDVIGLVFIMVSFVGSFVINLSLNKLRFKMDRSVKFKERKRSYYSRIFYLKEFAKEIRLNDLAASLKDKFSDVNVDIRNEVDRHSKKIILLSFLGKYVFNDFFFNGLYMLYLIYQVAVTRVIGFGSFLALFRLSSNLKLSLEGIASLVPDLQSNSLYIDKLLVFLNTTPTIKHDPGALSVPASWKVLEFKDVSFTYGDKPVLKNINLRIIKGKKFAIVGYNGAGKTTLIKLIMRLYDATSGEILLDGINIKLFKLNEYRLLFSSVFQDYQLYAAGLDENVKMDECTEVDRENIYQALSDAGFYDKLSTLPLGLQTPITTEFEDSGVDLSGGEAQKIAISRTFFHESEIVILDEPSSALDPISEYHLYDSMLRLMSDKTLMFISHRLSSTKMADVIFLLKEGRVIEQGSHDELMRGGRDYARMFSLQSRYYLTL